MNPAEAGPAAEPTEEERAETGLTAEAWTQSGRIEAGMTGERGMESGRTESGSTETEAKGTGRAQVLMTGTERRETGTAEDMTETAPTGTADMRFCASEPKSRNKNMQGSERQFVSMILQPFAQTAVFRADGFDGLPEGG